LKIPVENANIAIVTAIAITCVCIFCLFF
jgi:hypothetical protein